MGFCFLGTGKSGDLPPRPECALTWRDRLVGHLRHLEVTLVDGQYAQEYHLRDAPSSNQLRRRFGRGDLTGPGLSLFPSSLRNNIWLNRIYG
jgi:uracil-DNA glycosylase